MEAIKVKTYVGSDGILKLELPAGVANRKLEVLVVMQPLEAETVNEMGYPLGYFEETYGSFTDEPLERPPDLPPDSRDEIE